MSWQIITIGLSCPASTPKPKTRECVVCKKVYPYEGHQSCSTCRTHAREKKVEIETTMKGLIDGWVTSAEQSKDKYPVDFDQLWRLGGYSRKDHAKTAILRYLIDDIDYNLASAHTGAIAHGGENKENITLTTLAAKQFLMMASTDQGRAARLYFIECEEKWRLLKTNVDNGRIELHDKLTGETVSNPYLNDPKYRENRLDAAKNNVLKNQEMQEVKFPGLDGADYPKINAMISEWRNSSQILNQT